MAGVRFEPQTLWGSFLSVFGRRPDASGKKWWLANTKVGWQIVLVPIFSMASFWLYSPSLLSDPTAARRVRSGEIAIIVG